jgi:DNA-binding MarR family transcriptional regulator
MTAKPAKAAEAAQGAGLAEAVADLAHHVLHLFAEAGRGHKLSQQQVELICAVIVRGSVGMTELGSVLHVEKSSLSNLVDRLEQRGLVVRTRDPNDRRATRVSLTGQGTAVAVQTRDDVIARLRCQLSHLAPAEQDRLAAVARELAQAGQPLPDR